MRGGWRVRGGVVVGEGGVQGNESITQEAALLCTHGNVFASTLQGASRVVLH